MNVISSKRFKKNFRKLPLKIQEKFDKQLDVFLDTPGNKKLNDHPLKGAFKGYRSINITSDIRAIYKKLDTGDVYFVAIGSHSNLYF